MLVIASFFLLISFSTGFPSNSCSCVETYENDNTALFPLIKTGSDPIPSPINCTDPLYDCTNHGICNSKGNGCVCDKNWATYEPPEGTQCNYKRVSRTLGTVLAAIPFTTMTGAHWYIISDNVMGTMQLLFGGYLGIIVILFIGCCCGICCAGGGDDAAAAAAGCGIYFAYLVVSICSFAFWIYSIVAWASYDLVDGNGIQISDF